MNVQKFLRRPDKSLRMSAPPVQELYGVKIRKLPMGEVPAGSARDGGLAGGCARRTVSPVRFHAENASMLEHIDRGGMTKLAVRLLAVLPEQFCRMVSSLLDIHRNVPAQPGRVRRARAGGIGGDFGGRLEGNDLSGFFGTVRRLLTPAGNLEFWFQRWIAIAQNVGIPGRS